MAKMLKSTRLLTIYAVLLFTAVALSSPATASAGIYEIGGGYFPVAMSSPKICEGSIGECLSDDDEFDLESESSRRMLAYRRRYISYGALSRNRVPCSRRGVSYYNCRPGAPANPYRRGCSAITRCRG